MDLGNKNIGDNEIKFVSEALFNNEVISFIYFFHE